MKKYFTLVEVLGVVALIAVLGAIGFGVVIQHPVYIFVSVICGLSYFLTLKHRSGLKVAVFLLPMFLFMSFINPFFNHDGTQVLFYPFGNLCCRWRGGCICGL